MKLHNPQEVGFSAERLNRINGNMQQYVTDKKLAGTVTLVARHGKVVYFEKRGWQDVASNTEMELDTIFRIYSMTKPIVSTALMMLHEQGLFQLSDPLLKFIPAFKKTKVLVREGKLVAPKRDIIIRDLLRHTAGLGYGSEDDSPVEEMYRQADLFRPDRPLAEIIQQLADIPLIYHPGQSWRYSFATDIVGRLVEILADMSLADFLAEKIFNPLGMIDTAFWLPPEKQHRLTTLYGPTDTSSLGELDFATIRDYNPDTLKMYAGGHGLLSTISDYFRFAQLMLNQGVLDDVRLLGRKSVELMTRNHLPASLMPLSYNGVVNQVVSGFGFGLGFRVMHDPGLAGVMGSPGCHGWGGAANTVFWLDPQEQLLGINMAQYMGHDGVHPSRNTFRTLVYQALID